METKYKPEMCDRLLMMMKNGASVTEVAADLGVRRGTIYDWARDPRKPEWKDALELGKERSEAWWIEKGRNGTFGISSGRFNAASWIYTMKCRFRGRWLEDNTSKVQF